MSDFETLETFALVERMAEKDMRAYAEVYRRYSPRVSGYLRSRGLAASAAEGVTQQVLLRVWKKADTFDPFEGEARAWIFRMTRDSLAAALASGVEIPTATARTARTNEPVDRRTPPHSPVVGDLVQGTSVERPASNHTLTHEPFSAPGVVESSVSGKEKAIQVLERYAQGGFPPAEGHVLQLAYFHGHSSDQIADQLGVAPDAVALRLRGAIERLRTSRRGDKGEE